VGVAGGCYIRTGFVNLGVDCESSGVDGLVTLDDDTFFVDQDEIGDFYLREVLGEGIEPEVVS
jgi:hypothetical protein